MDNKLKNSSLDIVYNNLFLYRLYKIFANFNFGSNFKYKYSTKDVIVCGMPRSGSTLVFNIVKEILQERIKQNNTYFYRDSQLHNLYKNDISNLVKKNHRYSPLLARRIHFGHSIGFFTYRDIRDVVVSLIQKKWIENFDLWVKQRKLKKIINDSILYAKTENMILIEYEKLINNHVEYIEKIGRILNTNLGQTQIEKILLNTNIEAAKNKIRSLNTDEIDTDSHLHQNHIKDGMVGKWKNILTAHQINLINIYGKDYLNFFGYER